MMYNWLMLNSHHSRQITKLFSAIALLGLMFSVVGSGRANFIQAQGNGTTTRVSVASDGTQGNGNSGSSVLSADGRYVAFTSAASNLVSGDTNGVDDVFVHDRQTGQTTRVSIASDGTQGNAASHHPSISGDGRYVAFVSTASNLVLDDTNGFVDVFVHDRQTNQTTRVSVASDGTQSNENLIISLLISISVDGRYIAFSSSATNLVLDDTNGFTDVFVHDRQTGQTTRVSGGYDSTQANGDSVDPYLSADGRYVAFDSGASNLAPNDTNSEVDIFVHDRQTGETTRISVSSDGTQADGDSVYPSTSADGRYVAFTSFAGNLVANDTAGSTDVFVHDRQAGQTSRVSVTLNGAQANGESYSYPASISADGRYVTFASFATNLAPNDTNGGTMDVFVHDRLTGQTTLASVGSDDMPGSGPSYNPAISADGRYVTFNSGNTLVSGDTNGFLDTFVHDRGSLADALVLFRPDSMRPPLTLRPLFDWGSVSGATSYTLQISTNQNFTTLALNKLVTPSAYVPTSDLPRNTLLFWRVRANGLNGLSGWSRVRHFYTPNPPGVPVPVSPANNATVAGSQPTLDWNDVTPAATYYEVQISADSAFTTLLGRGRGGRTSFSQYTPEAPLASSQTFFWRVRAVNEQGQFSQWSAVRSFRTP
jgi:Tol biopolymer transport system component